MVELFLEFGDLVRLVGFGVVGEAVQAQRAEKADYVGDFALVPVDFEGGDQVRLVRVLVRLLIGVPDVEQAVRVPRNQVVSVQTQLHSRNFTPEGIRRGAYLC